MNTPSKEALEAAKELTPVLCPDIPKQFETEQLKRARQDRIEYNAAIIDRHFETLRRDNATLAGRLTAAELERDSLGARAEKAEAEIERWRVATAKLRDGAEEAGRVANEQIARAEARAEELETERDSARSQAVSARDSLNREMSESTQKARHYEAEIDALRAANAELAGALREMVDAQDATVEQFTETEIDRLEKAMRVSREVLARHASGEPAQEACGGRCGDPHCNLSTVGELMREPAKHPEMSRHAQPFCGD